VITIAWDIDDVLNNLMSAWFHTAWLPTHPDCTVKYGDLTENPPDRILGISQQEYLESLDAFRLSETARRMAPTPEILDWFRSQGHQFRHIALTARPLETTPALSEWLFRHFGSFVRLFAVVPTRWIDGEPVYDRTKAEFLAWFGLADLLVDDTPANIESVQHLGIEGILYPQPWNSSKLTVAETLQSLMNAAAVRSVA